MSTLRIILDDMISGESTNRSRYTENLTRGLIATAPRGAFVEGFVSLHKSSLAGRELTSAWQHGFTRMPGSGMVHAPSLLAPLARHDRLNEVNQIAVTIHDTLAWSNPEALTSRRVGWYKSMLKRAERYADAIVVPTHAVADEITELSSLGDRVRVISGAPSSVFTTSVATESAEDDRFSSLSLPERFVLAIVEPGSRGAALTLARSIGGMDESVPLLIVGIEPNDPELASAIAESKLADQRILALGVLGEPELRVVVERAAVLLAVTFEEGWGMPVLEAFALGTPVVHLGTPALVELSDGAALVVDPESADTFGDQVSNAITSILEDSALADRLKYSGLDRARAFTWRSAAEKIWQLHADL